MRAVSNSSVLISLSIIGQLDLLHKRFPDGILIPAAVWHEVIEAALQLYKKGEVTLGRAAEIAGITRWEFETLLADRGIERSVASDSVENLERQVERLQPRA